MRLLAIQGSPHGVSGATAKLLNEVLRGAETAGLAATTLSLTDYRVEPCCGCEHCHVAGGCTIHDDYPEILRAMRSADGIVLASPNYMFGVTAQMKALIDRCSSPVHCQLLEDKYAAAVCTSGGGGEDDVNQYMLRFLRSLGCWTVGGVGATAGQLADPEQSAARFAAAHELGTQLGEAIRRRQTFPHQAQQRQAFFERMKELVTARQNAWPYEYEYWKSAGRM